MTILVTGSAGHLGEALMRTLRGQGSAARGLDLKASPFTDAVGSITNRDVVRSNMTGVEAVLHTATLHKPHVATHSYADFVDTNVTGTLVLLEEAARAGVSRFVFTSTTSTFGAALSPPPGAPAAWITEDVVPIPKNIYGVTKLAAESLCQLFARKHGLAAIALRTARFFPEPDDNPAIRETYDTANAQANELLYRRADIADMVSAHLAALNKAGALGFGRYIVSATPPFNQADLADLRDNAPDALRRHYPEFAERYAARGWSMFPSIDRVYDNARARRDLDWRPTYDFTHVLNCLRDGTDFRSPLARAVGSKGYHDTVFDDGPYPVG